MMTDVPDRVTLLRLLREGQGPHYVYVLRWPDGVACFGGLGTPFYVGHGQNDRLFLHEEEAKSGGQTSEKVDAIRAIWRADGQVRRTIEGFYKQEPFIREAGLIHEIGRQAEGRGPLLNAQTYSPSHQEDGVELRKYVTEQRAAGGFDEIPATFNHRKTRFAAGPRQPKSLTTVMGKVYATAAAHPGVTGEELIYLLMQQDFSSNKSAYTQSGQVCASWICGYITGAYTRSDKQHLQEFKP